MTFYTNPSSGGSITVSGVGTYSNGQSASLSPTSYSIAANPPTNYQFSSWSYSGGVSVSGGQTGTMTVSAAGTVTANFQIIQYSITFTSSGIGGDSSGTIVVVNGNSKTQAQLPYTASYDSGSTINYEFTATVPDGSGKQYLWISTSGLGQTGRSGSFTASASGTVTGSYSTQYQVTFTSSGIDGDSSGTIVTVNGDAKIQSQLPYTAWYDSTATISYEFSVAVSAGSGKQYAWSSTSGLGQTGRTGSFQPSSSGTVTGSYFTQYQIAFTSSGIGEDSSGTVVIVNSNTKSQSQLPYAAWYDGDSTVDYEFSTTVSSTTTGKRYAWESTSGLGQSGISGNFIVSSSGIVTGTYKIQYQVSVTVDPSGGGSVSGDGWFDDGDQCSLLATPSSSYRFDSWGGDGSGLDNPLTLIVNSPKNVVAYFIQTVSITITSSPTGSGFVKVDGIAISTPQIYTWDVGSQHALEAVSPVSGGTGIQYMWTSWSDGGGQTHTYTTPSSVQTVTATYLIQYELVVSVDISGGGSISPSSGSYWYNSGEDVSISAVPSENYRFDRWILDGSDAGSTNPISVTMSGAHNLVAKFIINVVTITFQVGGVGDDASGIVLTIDGVQYARSQLPTSFSWTAESTHQVAASDPILVGLDKQYLWANWTDGDGLYGSSGEYVVPPSNQTVIANYRIEYQLIIEVDNPSNGTTEPPPGNYWYYLGSVVQVQAVPNPGLSFNQWLLDGVGAGSSNPIIVVMNQAHTVRAVFGAVLVNVTVTSSPTGSGFVKVDDIPITTPKMYSWLQGESHEVEALSPVSGDGFQYVWASWSDGGAPSHGVVAYGLEMVILAEYEVRLPLTIEEVSGNGTTNPPSPGKYWYGVDSVLQVSATSGVFGHWLLDGEIVTGNPINITMDQEHILRAVFRVGGEKTNIVTVLAKSSDDSPISDIQVKMDGLLQSTDRSGRVQFIGVTQGSHMVEVTSPTEVLSIKYIFSQWSDGGASNPRSITIAGEDTELLSVFNFKYKLTTRTLPLSLEPPPTIDPSSPDKYYDGGATVQLTANDVGGLSFYAWSINGVEQPTGQKTVSVKMEQPTITVAIYTREGGRLGGGGGFTLISHNEYVVAIFALTVLGFYVSVRVSSSWKRFLTTSRRV